MFCCFLCLNQPQSCELGYILDISMSKFSLHLTAREKKEKKSQPHCQASSFLSCYSTHHLPRASVTGMPTMKLYVCVSLLLTTCLPIPDTQCHYTIFSSNRLMDERTALLASSRRRVFQFVGKIVY